MLLNQSDNILKSFASKKGQIAVLIDPEKTHDEKSIINLCQLAKATKVSYFFVGGSTVTRKQVELTVGWLKKHTEIPVVLFPGSSQQLSDEADALLYLSLISGRNPDFLIGHHISSADEVSKMDIEVIPTGYVLIDGGTQSSVAYVSQTTPIPRKQNTIAYNTALAGILQGKKAIFFDAGSGAKDAVPPQMIEQITALNKVPVIVGGGIKTRQEAQDLILAGANVIVVGNKIEETPEFLLDLMFTEKI